MSWRSVVFLKGTSMVTLQHISWGPRRSLLCFFLSAGWMRSCAEEAGKAAAPREKHKYEHLFENYRMPPAKGIEKRKPYRHPENFNPRGKAPPATVDRGKEWNLHMGPTEPHPWLKHLKTQEEVDRFENSLKPGEFAVVGHAKENTRFHNLFNNVAHKLFDEETSMSTFKCAVQLLDEDKHHIVDAGVYITSPDYTVFDTKDFKAHHNGRLWYSGRSAEPQILQWIRFHSYPLISHNFYPAKYSWPNIKDRGHWEGSVSILLRDKNSSNPLWPGLEESLRPVMLKYRKLLRFVTAEMSVLDHHTLHHFGAHNASEPLITVLKDRRRYTLEGELKLRDTEVLRKFIDDAVAHRLNGSYRSERPPAAEVDERGLVYLTGDNFERYVFDESRDVLVWFDHWEKCKEHARIHYPNSPEKGRCVQAYNAFEEILEKQAEDMRVNLTIGKFDDSKNDCIEEPAHSPMLILYPAVPADQKLEKKKVYQGKRMTAKSIADWARRVATHLQVKGKKKMHSAEL